MRRFQESPSKRQAKQAISEPDVPEPKKEKKRTNNGAKKKTHPECEIETVKVEPDSPKFKPELARYMCTCDVVRYSMVPMHFIKTIYKVKKYVQNGTIFKGSVPANPLLNSQYTSSFIAGLAELRYLHEYLCDIIDRCTAWPPNTSIEKYRDLLLDKWKQTQK